MRVYFLGHRSLEKVLNWIAVVLVLLEKARENVPHVERQTCDVGSPSDAASHLALSDSSGILERKYKKIN